MPKARKLTPSAKPSDLFEDIRALIEQARAATARAINSAVTLLYWQVGQRIRRDVLHEQRAEYAPLAQVSRPRLWRTCWTSATGKSLSDHHVAFWRRDSFRVTSKSSILLKNRERQTNSWGRCLQRPRSCKQLPSRRGLHCNPCTATTTGHAGERTERLEVSARSARETLEKNGLDSRIQTGPRYR
jgi:hypothetical protein